MDPGGAIDINHPFRSRCARGVAPFMAHKFRAAVELICDAVARAYVERSMLFVVSG